MVILYPTIFNVWSFVKDSITYPQLNRILVTRVIQSHLSPTSFHSSEKEPPTHALVTLLGPMDPLAGFMTHGSCGQNM